MTYLQAVRSTVIDMCHWTIWATIIFVLWAFLSTRVEAQTWSCQTVGNTIYCSGMQNGRYVSCTTTIIGQQSYTTCT